MQPNLPGAQIYLSEVTLSKFIKMYSPKDRKYGYRGIQLNLKPSGYQQNILRASQVLVSYLCYVRSAKRGLPVWYRTPTLPTTDSIFDLEIEPSQVTTERCAQKKEWP